MLKVDNIHFWPPVKPTTDEQGVLVPHQRLVASVRAPATPRDWFLKMVKTINVPSVVVEVDELFEEPEERNARKRAVEEAVEEAAKTQVDSEKKILASTAPAPPPVKKQATVYEIRTQQWFDTFHKEGRAGNVGLVPEPLRSQYPARAPLSLDPTVKAYVSHFCEWDKKN